MLLRHKLALVVFVVLALVSSAPAFDGMLDYSGSILWSGGSNVVMDDTLAYYTVFNGLFILDVSDPSSVDTLSMVYLYGGWSSDVVVAGTRAYVTTQDGIVYVIDVSNPLQAFVAGSYETSGSTNGIDVAGDLAFVAYFIYNIEQGLLILDVSNPNQIEEVGFISTDYPALKVRVQGDYAYVVGLDLWIFDVSIPSSPVLSCHFPTGYGPVDLDIRGDLVFLADEEACFPVEQSAFTILDVSDKEAPVIAGRIPLWGECTDVLVANDSIVLVANSEFMRTVDYSDPTQPDTIGKYEISCHRQLQY